MKKKAYAVGLLAIALAHCSSERKNDIALEESQTVVESNFSDVSQKIAFLSEEKKEADSNKNRVRSALLQIELNYLTELLAIRDKASGLLRSAIEEEIRILQSKYAVLRDLFEKERREYEATGFVSEDQKKMAIEGFLEGPNFASSYNPLVLREEKKVFDDFGSLYIKEHKKKDGRPSYKVVEAKNRSWSGFWYPVTSKFLYEGDSAPLKKWQDLLEKRGHSTQIVKQEAERYLGYVSTHWDGYCDYWSKAAVLVPEPKQSKIIDGIEFTIADQKALHTYAHGRFDKKMYGIPYLGTRETDGAHDDLVPSAFHRIATHVLGVEKRALVVDIDPGTEVWNKPFDRYSWSIEKDPQLNYAYLVSAIPWYVNHRDEESDRLTANSDILAPRYTYRLYVDKSQVRRGKFKVIAGQWTGASLDNHPDTVTYPLKDGQPSSHNSEFNKHLQEYKELLLNAP